MNEKSLQNKEQIEELKDLAKTFRETNNELEDSQGHSTCKQCNWDFGVLADGLDRIAEAREYREKHPIKYDPDSPFVAIDISEPTYYAWEDTVVALMFQLEEKLK